MSPPDSGYLGTHDTVMSQNDSSANFSGDVTLYADGDNPPGPRNDLSTLRYWDISVIPADSTVKEVSITQMCSMRRMIRASYTK